MQSEQQIQKKIIDRHEADGWMSVKFMKCNKNGWPDLQFHRNGITKFVEVKKPGGRIAPLQKYRIEQLRKQGFEAVVMNGIESIIF